MVAGNSKSQKKQKVNSLTYKQKMELVEEWKDNIALEVESEVAESYKGPAALSGIKAEYSLGVSNLQKEQEISTLTAKEIMELYKRNARYMRMHSILEFYRIEAGIPPNPYPKIDPFHEESAFLDIMRSTLGERINEMADENINGMVNMLFDLFPEQTAFATRPST